MWVTCTIAVQRFRDEEAQIRRMVCRKVGTRLAQDDEQTEELKKLRHPCTCAFYIVDSRSQDKVKNDENYSIYSGMMRSKIEDCFQ